MRQGSPLRRGLAGQTQAFSSPMPIRHDCRRHLKRTNGGSASHKCLLKFLPRAQRASLCFSFPRRSRFPLFLLPSRAARFPPFRLPSRAARFPPFRLPSAWPLPSVSASLGVAASLCFSFPRAQRASLRSGFPRRSRFPLIQLPSAQPLPSREARLQYLRRLCGDTYSNASRCFCQRW